MSAQDSLTRANAHVAGGYLTSVDTRDFAQASAHLSLAGNKTRKTVRVLTAVAADLAALRQAAHVASFAADTHVTEVTGTATTQSLCEALDATLSCCAQISQDCAQATQNFEELSDAVARAGNLYSNAESSLLSILTKGNWIVATEPFTHVNGMALTGGAFALTAAGNSLGAQLLRSTDENQEGWLRTFARTINPISIFSKDPVNETATVLTPFAWGYSYLAQGSHLKVSRAHPKKQVVQQATNISDGLKNLDNLASSSAVPYSTVAVQKYEDSDGTARWVVYVPGTNEHKDSPMGWGQNIELMSSNNSARMSASSVKLVEQAMKASGVKPTDSVVIVGHSQGGIVAASIAASRKYNVTHIVTAGSPIANHPIPQSTWVTSIETQGELVSKLDGAKNPQRRTWTTVSGTISSPPPTLAPSTNAAPPLPGRHSAQGAPVAKAPQKPELTHGMNYHRATWKDATDLGNRSVEETDAHFREQTRGKLVSTEYYTGRMTRDDNS